MFSTRDVILLSGTIYLENYSQQSLKKILVILITF